MLLPQNGEEECNVGSLHFKEYFQDCAFYSAGSCVLHNIGCDNLVVSIVKQGTV